MTRTKMSSIKLKRVVSKSYIVQVILYLAYDKVLEKQDILCRYWSLTMRILKN